jgi:hypothetical protein
LLDDIVFDELDVRGWPKGCQWLLMPRSAHSAMHALTEVKSLLSAGNSSSFPEGASNVVRVAISTAPSS